MIMATNPQYPNEYEYAPPMAAATTPSMRPTLDVYYHHQPAHMPSYHHAAVPTPSPHHGHHHSGASLTPHAYYVAPHHQHHAHYIQHYASTPSALSSSASLKRKMSGSSVVMSPAAVSTPVSHAGTSPMAMAHEKLCDACHHPDPILFSAKCGHLFHSRCVSVWPLHQCPVCRVELPQVSILRIDMNEQIEARSGKWTRAEEKFIEMILQEFDRNCLPLSNGTPVRLVLAKLLNCSTMRLSKKFQKNALGKRTFRIPKPAKGMVAMEFNHDEHAMRQKEFSRLETIFRHELVEQFRRENNTDEGAYVETLNLRKAVKQFWVNNFLKFAVVVGQPVEGLDVSDAKKKKLALQMLRDGQYDALLSWHASSSSNSSPSVATSVPRVPRDAMHANAHHQVAHWSSGYANPAVDVDCQQGPIKKQRTPETVARLQQMGINNPPHFELHQHQQHPVATYDYSRAGYAASQYQQHDGGYSYTSAMKQMQDRGSLDSYDSMVHSPQHQHQQVQPYPEPASAHEMMGRQAATSTGAMSYAGYRTTMTSAAPATSLTDASFQSNTMASSSEATSAGPVEAPTGANPWDGLLEEISTEPAQHVVDPSLQAWSNLSMM